MKNILMILVVAAVAMTSCKNETQNLSNSFDNLQKESDSLLQVHMTLKAAHAEHMSNNMALTERLSGIALEDSTWLETLAKQQVVLKNHDAQFQKHEQLLSGHQELKANFNSLTPEEMQAQIDAMESDLNEIDSDQSTLSNEHEALNDELAKIREKLSKQQTASRERE